MNPDRIVRITLLSQIFHETYDFYHRNLTHSIFGRKLFKLPFHRDVSLTLPIVTRMLEQIRFCRRVEGCLIVTSEDRNSLTLKREELYLKGG